MTDYILSDYPDKEEMLNLGDTMKDSGNVNINCHIHTPFSFSAFKDMDEIFELAKKENIRALGINDFFVADGYPSFYQNCLKNRVFPLFNIEFIGLLKEEQEKGIRVNDPSNPGRTYLSGKGLDYPFELDPAMECMLKNITTESQIQVKEMIEKAAALMNEIEPEPIIKYSEIKRLFARELVRERHIAKAIRSAIYSRYKNLEKRAEVLKQLYGGKESKADPDNHAQLENEIRSNLLKSGGRAYVQEDANAFLPIPQIIQIILNAGGIPCYPVLLDDPKGELTEYEVDWQLLLNELKNLNIHCIELIPGRNDITILKEFVQFFRKNDFIVCFGTEHNTPEMIPLTVTARNNVPLDEELLQASLESTCVIAAHQYLHAKKKEGYVSIDGHPKTEQIAEFIKLGKAVIRKFIS